jgi:hypothetical protein
MMSDTTFTDFEKNTLYAFFEELDDYMARARCNDFYFPKDWTEEQKNEFSKKVFEALDEEYEDGDGPGDFMVLKYLVKKLAPLVEGTISTEDEISKEADE